MRALVTGGAGFIGSNLVDRLLADGHEVVAYDDLSTGQSEFLSAATRSPAFQLVQGDICDRDKLAEALRGADTVFHLAANADVRHGLEHPRRDLEKNTIGTFEVLEAMRAAGVRRIAFSSTGSVYGEPEVFPTPETCPFPTQTSLYAASKLAGEALISAYAEGFGISAWIFRFVSVLGERYSHGHIFDFCQALRADPSRLKVLGDGQQRKSYMHVGDCVDAMLLAMQSTKGKLSILNLGTDEYCRVDDSIGWITAELGLSPKREYTGDRRGWVGDSPFIFLDTARIRSLGWRPRLSIREGVVSTVRYLRENPWLLDRRS